MRRRNVLLVFVLICLWLSATLSQAQDNVDWILPLLPDADAVSSVQKLLDDLQTDLQVGITPDIVRFDAEDEWEYYDPVEGYARVQDGAYQILNTDTESVVWGQNETEYTNVLIDVEVEQLSVEEDNGYGVMCRANPENDGIGYYFFISGDGFYRIMAFTDDGVDSLTEWVQTPLIAQGQARNRLSVLCYEDQLALFINNQLATSLQDDRLTSGVLGLFGNIYVDDTNLEVHFDNLRAWSVVPRPDFPADLEADLTQGSVPLRVSNALLNETFDEDEVWNSYSNGTGVDLDVASGVYRANTNQGQGFVNWGLSLKEYDNVVIQVETSDNSDDPNNGYGITCRSAGMNNSDGYYLFISADGFYQIMRSVEGDFESLVEWTRSEVVNLAGDNTLTAVCVDDYLALYVNGLLLVEYTDDDPLATQGFVGMSVVGYADEGVEVSVDFDNYRVWAAEVIR